MVTKRAAIGVALCALIGTITALLMVLLMDRNGAPTVVIEDAVADVEIAVFVDGAVNRPGLYRLPGDARLNDAVDAAGGFAEDADLSRLNLAERLADEQTVSIPSLHGGEASPAASGGGAAQDGRIDINTAGVAELDALPGIGPVLAQRIVDYRGANGPFTRIEELARVDGISPQMVDEIAEWISVGP